MRPKYASVTPPESLERAWQRADMPPWEARWATVPQAARWSFLKNVHVAPVHLPRPLPNPTHLFPEPMLQAWRDAGLIAAHDAKSFVVAPEALPFYHRLNTLQHANLLDPASPGGVYFYANVASNTYALQQAIARLVEHATGMGHYRIEGDPIGTFASEAVWPDWVANYLADPLAKPLLAAFEKAEKPVPLSRVGELLPDDDPAAVRATLDQLVIHLALVEGLDAKTADILVGLLPAVARQRRTKREVKTTQLRECVAKEVGPEAGLTVPDLRAFLLEVATLPPKLKQDDSLYQKEAERFLQALEPQPEWLLPPRINDLDARLLSAYRWALRMEFVDAPSRRTETKVLRLTDAGQEWLALDRESQFAALATYAREKAPNEGYWGWSDQPFLGSPTIAVLASGSQREFAHHHFGVMPREQKQPLREALYHLFTELPVGTFYRIDDVIAWGSEMARNPLLLRRSLREVTIRVHQRQLPPFEEGIEKAARQLLNDFVRERLVTMGCVQVGRDEKGKVLLARLPRLDVYFGKAAPASSPALRAETRVIVQPDFTIVVIGLDAAPAAELAPFCDRQRASGSSGSLTFRLSRESVLRGVAEGIPVEQMVKRLETLASKTVPANVLTELRTWGGLVRKVTVRTAILFQCPDAATAGRVKQVLGKRAELAGETSVAWPADEKLTASLRKKLQDQGIFIEGKSGSGRKRSSP